MEKFNSQFLILSNDINSLKEIIKSVNETTKETVIALQTTLLWTIGILFTISLAIKLFS